MLFYVIYILRNTPDRHNDWLNQRDDSFDKFIAIGDKKDKNSIVVFDNYSSGIKTNRDAWCYNYSKEALKNNMASMINFYNNEVDKYKVSNKAYKFSNDPKKISWNRSLKNDLDKFKKHGYEPQSIYKSFYRPYSKQYAYFNRQLNDMVYQMHKVYPEKETSNFVISVAGVGAGKGFSTLMLNSLPNLHVVENGQYFPLHLYEENSKAKSDDLFAGQSQGGYTKKDGITDAGLAHFKTAYPTEKISKEDIFYYIYGLLHSEEYRTKYADNLSKQLPRIPCVKTAQDFWAFLKAGRKLAELHINYETVAQYPVKIETGIKKPTDADYYVTKMKFAKKGDKSKVIYNHNITISNIPLEAYDYIVNGKPALEWVMERQCVKTDKASGIVNDANLYATETVGDAAYPLKLFQRIITVSLETMKIVNDLPKLELPE